jgi:tripartite-type tricarboxylate transporter receptor subunit TctC
MRLEFIRNLGAGLAASVATALLTGPAVAQGTAPSFAGKTIELWIGAAPAGGYDVNARAVARYLPDHIPGKPTILPKNMPGAGSVRATNLVYNTAPKDGTVIGAPSRAVITMPLLGVENAKFDPTKMLWVGSVSSEDSSGIAWHTSGIKTLADAQKKKLIVGTSGPGTSTHTYALLLQNLFDAKFDIIGGYPDGKSTQIALERGEVQGTCGSISSLKTQKPDWVREKKINFLVLIGANRDPDLPDVPSVMELANDEQRSILKVVLAPQTAGRPLFLPPDVPMDRVAVLRRAFDSTMKDNRFIDDAKKIGLEVNPSTGEDIQKMIADVYALPPAVIAKAKGYLESR